MAGHRSYARADWVAWCAILIYSACAAPAAGGEQLVVAASIAPLADFVRHVGGERVEVITLVPPGASPHTYELKPSQVVSVARARLLVLNGAGLEYWADKLVNAADNPRLEVVDTSEGLPLIDSGDDDDHKHGEHGGNPHVWLDVRQAMIQVQRIRNALGRIDPDRSEEYQTNAARYLATLETLDREIAHETAGWRTKDFIAFHPAWIYFARRYGLTQAAVVEASPGREPSPVEIARVVETVKRLKAGAVFAEAQFSPKAAEAIARESGVRVILLDPLGAEQPDFDYAALLRQNVARMGEVMR